MDQSDDCQTCYQTLQVTVTALRCVLKCMCMCVYVCVPRVAVERGEPEPGRAASASASSSPASVAYQVRLDSTVTQHTKLTFCTTGEWLVTPGAWLGLPALLSRGP